MRLKLLGIHGRIVQRTREGSNLIVSLVIAPTLVRFNVIGLRGIHARKLHRETLIIIGDVRYAVSTVDVFFLNAHPFRAIRCYPRLSTSFRSERFYSFVGAAVFHDAEAFHETWTAVCVRLLLLRWAPPIFSRGERSIAILLAVQIGEQRKQIFWIVLVHGWIRGTANNNHGKSGVANQHHDHPQNEGVGGNPIFHLRPPNGERQESNEHGCIDHDTRIEPHPQVIHKKQLEFASQIHNAFDQSFLNKAQDSYGDSSCNQQPFPRKFMPLEIVHQRNGRNGQQIQQVNPNG